MYDVLTNPITLLCLGIVFLLISFLFFYFKRSLSLLERAQMEQARILQSFITNMEMSQQQQMAHHQQMMSRAHINNNVNEMDGVRSLIDVSDESKGGDSDNDSDSDDEVSTSKKRNG